MKNHFKARNFDNHLDNGYVPIALTDDECKSAMAVSNHIHDQNRGVTHFFLHTNKGNPDDRVRLVGDVELAMSSSLDVRSIISPEMQQRLRLGLANQPRSGSSRLSDDDLTRSVPANFGFERDESVVMAKSQLSRFRSSMSEVDQTTSQTPVQTPADSGSSSSES